MLQYRRAHARCDFELLNMCTKKEEKISIVNEPLDERIAKIIVFDIKFLNIIKIFFN